MEDLEINVSPSSSSQNCPFCQSQCSDSESVVSCQSCNARHHNECWEEHGKCSSCGDLERVVEMTAVPLGDVATSAGELDITVTATSTAQSCPFCHGGFSGDESVFHCQSCNAKHHSVCWDDHGQCASCGELESLVEMTVDRGPRRRRRPGLELNLAPALQSMGDSLGDLFGGRRSRLRRRAQPQSRPENRLDPRERPIRSKKRSKDSGSMVFGFVAIMLFFLFIPVVLLVLFGILAVF